MKLARPFSIGGVMIKRIIAIMLIYACITVAWVALSATVAQRTETQDERLKSAVGQLWGTAQRQTAPAVYYQTTKETKVETATSTGTTVATKTEEINHFLLMDASDIYVDL